MDRSDDDFWQNIGQISDGQAPMGRDAYLSVETVENIIPLDAQFGIWPKICVPQPLMTALFEQPEPTAAEIDVWGSFEAVPPMRTYAIVHAEKFQGKSTEIEECSLSFRSLFTGKAAQERKDEAPYLIELSSEADFTRRLFTYDPNIPDDMTSAHLWQREPGMYVRSRASIDVAWKHFRRFTRFCDTNGKWVHFNFWESSVFPRYWSYFYKSYSHAARFFSARDFSVSYQFSYLYQGVLTTISPNMEKLKVDQQEVPKFSLTPEDYKFFQTIADERFRETVRSNLEKKIKSAPDDQKDRISWAVDGAFTYIKARSQGALIEQGDCLTLAFLALLWGDAAREILRGSMLNERLLTIGQRIALAKATYFETLKTLSGRGL